MRNNLVRGQNVLSFDFWVLLLYVHLAQVYNVFSINCLRFPCISDNCIQQRHSYVDGAFWNCLCCRRRQQRHLLASTEGMIEHLVHTAAAAVDCVYLQLIERVPKYFLCPKKRPTIQILVPLEVLTLLTSYGRRTWLLSLSRFDQCDYIH